MALIGNVHTPMLAYGTQEEIEERLQAIDKDPDLSDEQKAEKRQQIQDAGGRASPQWGHLL